MPSPLDNLTGPAKALAAEAVDRREYDGLVSSARNKLADAMIATLSLESRFDLAYNASHWRILYDAHGKRNLADYEGDLRVELAFVEAMIDACRKVQAALVRLGPL